MHPLMDCLNVPGWRPVRFVLHNGQLVDDPKASDARALRREQWIIAGDQYVFVERMSPSEPWSEPEIGEWSYVEDPVRCGDKVRDISDLLPIATRALADGATIHPVLAKLLSSAAA
jgi:hypothetical protein